MALTVVMTWNGEVATILNEYGEEEDFELDKEEEYYTCADCERWVRKDKAEWLNGAPRCYDCFKDRGYD